jgi:hypothetical protein
VSVNPTDGSCWVAELGHDEEGVWVNSAVVHLAMDGTELWRGTSLAAPRSVSVNPTDGSCWVADSENDQVVHLAEDGTELWRGGGFDEPWSVSVSPIDGSCWVADRMNDQVVHLSESGYELERISGFAMVSTVSADPADGSCWAAPGSSYEVVHLAADGGVLWGGGDVESPQCVAVDPRDGSCWLTDCPHQYDAGYVAHLSSGGDRLSHLGGFYHYHSFQVTVGHADDSIWVADWGNSQVVRLRTWFDDVPRSHWAFEAILGCVDAGVVAGYPDDTYRPSATVTRDQMAVYIARALAGGDDGVPDPGGDPTFPDVLTDFWAYKYVEHVAANNVVAGYDDGLYHPEYSVDRAQMAVYVARALVAPSGEAALDHYVPSDPRDFPDVPDTYWAYKHVEYCAENGVVQGYDDGHYHPNWFVTRDQMAVYVARAFDVLG